MESSATIPCPAGAFQDGLNAFFASVFMFVSSHKSRTLKEKKNIGTKKKKSHTVTNTVTENQLSPEKGFVIKWRSWRTLGIFISIPGGFDLCYSALRE